MTRTDIFDRSAAAPALRSLSVDGRGRNPRRRTLRRARSITMSRRFDRAGPHDLAFLDIAKYAGELACDRAGACLIAERFAEAVPDRATALIARRSLSRFRSGGARNSSRCPASIVLFGAEGEFQHGALSIRRPASRAGVTIDPGAVMGRGAEIGAGTMVGANAVIGPASGSAAIAPSAANVDHLPCADRRPRDHPSRRPDRPGRLRLRSWARAATSRCRRSAASSSRTTSRSAPARRSTAAPSATR